MFYRALYVAINRDDAVEFSVVIIDSWVFSDSGANDTYLRRGGRRPISDTITT